jgi:hypothetical protein
LPTDPDTLPALIVFDDDHNERIVDIDTLQRL